MLWKTGSRGSSGSTVSDYGLDDRSPTGADFSSSPCVQTGSEAHPASNPVGTGGSFPGDKERPGRDADHSPPPSTQVKNELDLYLLSPHVPPWRVAGTVLLYFFYFMSVYVRHLQITYFPFNRIYCF
jgi:hypothetical protein